MPDHLQFLVIDNNADGRFLLGKTLLRKFPRSVIHEFQDANRALTVMKTTPLDAIVTHRTADVDGITLVQLLRRLSPHIPIVYVSGIDRSAAALEAGATRFLNYNEWLRIGTVVAELVAPGGESVLAGGIRHAPTVSSLPAR